MSTPVYPSMTPAAQDALQVLLCKAAYWAQTVAEAAGGPFTTGMYPNMTPFAQDPLQVLAAKLAYWLQQVSTGGGGSGTVQVYTGAAPPAAPADPTKAAIFYPSGGGSIQQWNVGTSAWI